PLHALAADAEQRLDAVHAAVLEGDLAAAAVTDGRDADRGRGQDQGEERVHPPRAPPARRAWLIDTTARAVARMGLPSQYFGLSFSQDPSSFWRLISLVVRSAAQLRLRPFSSGTSSCPKASSAPAAVCR